MKGLHFFKFNGVVSIDEQLIITNKDTYKGASRDLTFTEIPGRSGDLITDNRRYKNAKITYEVAALEGIHTIPEIAHRVKGWLLSEVGYFPLYDSYDPNYFRLASYSDEFDLEQELPALGSSSISFNCKPFRYSIEGQRAIILTTAQTVRNPEFFPASPYIKITGEGDITLSINADSFVFSGVDGYIEVDSEGMRAYKGARNENGKMYTPTFPKLYKGDNAISWSGSVQSVEIIPRWCCL